METFHFFHFGPGAGGVLMRWARFKSAAASAKGAASPQARTAPVTLYARFAAHLDAVLDGLVADGALAPGIERGAVAVEPPRDPSHGDLATNAAMVLARRAGTDPRALAALIAPKLEALGEVESAGIAGPGFINLRLAPGVWHDELRTILAEGDAYGRLDIGRGRRVNVEYVSANPTGPMHMGHCRGAVVGDALAALLEHAGYAVTREYYVNDAGVQVDVLARSVHLRYQEALGRQIGEIAEGLYPGDYLKPVGEALAREYGEAHADAPESTWLEIFRSRAVAAMLDLIKADLALLGVHHDLFASEREVQESGAVDRAFGLLGEKGLVYRGTLPPPKGKTPTTEDGSDWEPVELLLFRSTEYGDDQDRPIRKSDGSWTYFAADTAYHMQKLEASDELINVWGADHTGTVKRTQAAVQALAGRPALDVKIVQMVRLLRAGELVKMSKRSGSFVTLAEVVEEVGKDVVRFTMLTRKNDAQMDFDFAKVVEASKDNPVFYVQYAHARIRSLHRRAAESGLDTGEAADLALLDDEELGLVRLAAQFPRVVEAAAQAHEPHRIAFYLGDLAAAFHALWNRGNDDPSRRFLLEDNLKLTSARLELAAATGQILRNGLAIMGVAAAEEMQ
jgi:arginyl-tRNA synthetase